MPYLHEFTNLNEHYQHESGRLYLGVNPESKTPVGVDTERHGLLIAGAGSGKGAAIIMPNLKRWPHNVLTIDPKGEAAEAMAKHRDKTMGQSVYVLDPFKSAKVKKKYRASYNPLADLDPDSDTIKEDIDAITDGTVMRPDQTAAHWDDGAQAIISGLIAFVILHGEANQKNLVEVRRILRDDDAFALAMEQMKNETGCAGLCQDAHAAAFAKEGGYFVSNARKNTRWLDSKGMEKCLSSSSFSLSELKRGKASVFLVLPANYLSQHGRFLRLFVRCALEKMAEKLPSGELRGEQCLFLLDEFYSLGYIDEISKAAGLMRGYGLQLFPVLQDLGQLVALYGKEGAETFFGNADAHIFFGNTDAETLDYVSERVGMVSPNDIPMPPLKMGFEPSFWSGLTDWARDGETAKAHWKKHGIDREKEDWVRGEENAMRNYQYQQSFVGKPRLPADKVRELVMKGNGDVVARSMIVFAKGSDVLNVQLAPYFQTSFATANDNGDTINLEAFRKREAERKADVIDALYRDHMAYLKQSLTEVDEENLLPESWETAKRVLKWWRKLSYEKQRKFGTSPSLMEERIDDESLVSYEVVKMHGHNFLFLYVEPRDHHRFLRDFSTYPRLKISPPDLLHSAYDETDLPYAAKHQVRNELLSLRSLVEGWHEAPDPRIGETGFLNFPNKHGKVRFSSKMGRAGHAILVIKRMPGVLRLLEKYDDARSLKMNGSKRQKEDAAEWKKYVKQYKRDMAYNRKQIEKAKKKQAS